MDDPADDKLTTRHASEHLDELVDRAVRGKERLILTRRGKSLAAIVPMEDVKRLQELEDAQDIADAEAALKEADEKGTVSWSELKKTCGID